MYYNTDKIKYGLLGNGQTYMNLRVDNNLNCFAFMREGFNFSHH